jgi:hypothetical protein
MMLAAVLPALAQNYYSRANGNWNDPNTWSTTGFNGLPAATFPVAGDNVYIGGNAGLGFTVTANQVSQACASITFETASTTANILTISSSNTLTVSGAVTIPRASSGSNWLDVATGTLNAGSIDFTDGDGTLGSLHRLTATTGIISVSGNVTGTGVSGLISITNAGILRLGGALFDPTGVAGGTLSMSINSTVEYSSASSQTVQAFSYGGNLRLTGGGAKTMIGGVAISIGSSLAIGNNTSFTVGNNNILVAGTTTIGGGTGGILIFSSSAGNKFFNGLVTINANAEWRENANAAFDFQGGIVNNGIFTAFVPTLPTLPAIHSLSVNSQTLSGNFSIPRISASTSNTTITLNGSVTSSYLLTVGGGNTNVINNGTLWATAVTISQTTGTITNASTLSISGTTSGLGLITATSIGNIVNYTGTAAQSVLRGSYYHLNLSGAGAKTFPANISIAGDLTQTGGTITSSGTAATFNGAGNQSISGFTSLGSIELSGSGTKTFGTTISTAGFTIGNGTKAGLSGTNSVTSLTINGGLQAAQTYGSTLSSAFYPSDNFFAGTGLINNTTAVTTRSYYSIASGDWSSPLTWSTVGFGYTDNFGTEPVAGDLVTIGYNSVVTMSGTHSCASVTFDASTTTLTSSLSLSTGTLNVGTITIPRPASTAGSNVLDVGTGILNLSSTLTYTGTTGGAHRVTISTGTANMVGNVTSSASSSTLEITGAGNLNLQNSLFTDVPATFGTFTSATGSTVTYLGTTQTVRPVAYHHLVLSTGAKSSAAGTTTVNGDLTIRDNATYSVGNATLTVFGATNVGTVAGGTLTFATSSSGTKGFGGLITIGASATWSNPINEGFNIFGGISNSGTFSAGTGNYRFVTNNQSITGVGSIPSIIIETGAPSIALTINGTFTTNDLTINGVQNSLVNNGNLTISNTITGTGSIVQGTSSTLTITATGTLSNGIDATVNGNSVSYNNNAGSTQTVLNGNYYNLTLTGNGVKTMQVGTTSIAGTFTMSGVSGTVSTAAAAGITFGGDVSVGASATFTPGFFTHSVAGHWTCSPGSLTEAGSTFSFGGTNQTINNGTNKFYNLTLAGSGTKTFASSLDIEGTTTITSGVVVDLGIFTSHTTATLFVNGAVKLLGTHGNSAGDPDPLYIDDIYFAASPGKIAVEALIYYSRDNGLWSSASTWSNSTYGGAVGSSVPGIGSVVFIGGNSVTVDGTAYCSELSFRQGSTEDNLLTINSGITLTIAGSINIPRPTDNAGSNIVSMGSGNLTVGNVVFTTGSAGLQRIEASTGTLIVNGNISGTSTSNDIEFSGAGLLQLYGTLYTTGNGDLIMPSTATMQYAGTTQTITDRSYGGNLLVTGSGTKTWALNADRTIPGNLTVNSGSTLTISNNRAFTVSGTTNIGGSGAGAINIGGTDAIKTFTGDVTVSSNGSWSETFTGPANFGGSFNFSGSPYTAGTGVHTFSGTSETIGGNAMTIPSLTINGPYSTLGNLSISTALAGSGSLTMGSSTTLTIGGSLTLPTLDASATGTTVNFNGTSAQTVVIPVGGQFHNLQFNNTTSSGMATFASSGATVYVRGNLTNSGAVAVAGLRGFDVNGGTVVFNGTAAQFVNGTAPSTFYNLTTNSSVSVTLSTSTTVNGTLHMLTGNLQNASILTLGNGATINRNGATIYSGSAPVSGSPPSGNHYNLIYSGTGNPITGPETQGLHVKDVTISLSGTLTQANTLNLYGVMMVNSGATYDPGFNQLTVKSHSDTGLDAGGSIGTINGAFVTNPVTVERYFRARDDKDRFISSPVTSATIAQLQTAFPVTGKFTGTSYPACTGCLNNGYSLRWYKESVTGILNNGYQGYPKTDNQATLTPGIGYDAWMWNGVAPATVPFNGPINQGNQDGIGTDISTGQVLSKTVVGAGTLSADGWNLVGNPYPAPIRWTGSSTGGWTLNNIANQAWAWDVYNAVWVPINNGTDIAIGQAFWVQVTTPGTGTGTINITEAAKSPARSGAYYREQSTEPTLKINLSNGSVAESAFIVARVGASARYDWQYDFSKIELGIESLHMTLVKDDQHLGYYAYQQDMEADIPIRIIAEEEGLYELSFEELGGFPSLTDYFLLDMVNQERVAFSPNLRYSFTYTKKDPQHRFMLTRMGEGLQGNQHLVQLYPNPTSGVINVAINSVEPVRDVLLLNGAGQILNTNASMKRSGRFELSLEEYPAGVYLLKVITSTGVVVKRIVKN